MERIEQAMLAVPRADFLPPEYAEHAHIDAPLAIGHDQTNSQPTTVEIMLMLLGPRPGNKVLDVGSGSGWTTALLSELVGEKGYVWGVERVPDLVRMGQINLKASGAKSAEIRQAHRRKLGLAEEGPFDRILVSAEAKEIPAELVKQLAPGGNHGHSRRRDHASLVPRRLRTRDGVYPRAVPFRAASLVRKF